MDEENSVLNLENPLLKTYIAYTSLLGLKFLLMSSLTAIQRLRRGVFANPEDAKIKPKGKVGIDEDVERVRRAHLNDMENILVFMVISFCYVLSGPSVGLATNLFRIFTAARILHTLVYAVFVIPQPARGIAWMVGYGITIFMAGSLMANFISAL